jgi:TolB-like protein/tetratricopeptide (TPR) repeat protein
VSGELGSELRRRRVLSAAGLYIVASWVAIQAAATIFPLLNLPVGASKAVLAATIIGFIPAMVLAWIYDFKFGFGFSRTAARVGNAETNAGTEQTSLVVLPFINMSAQPDAEYFSDGIADELMNALARIEGLRVVSRTSAYSFRGRQVSTREIGATLSVGFVVEGSVRRAGNRLRMSVQLARVSDESLLWSESYERVLDDVFAVQDEVTSRIVQTIGATLQLGHMAGQVPVRPARNLQAYDLYLLGRHHSKQRTEAGIRRALELFEQAVAIDPQFAPAYSGLADASALLASWQFANTADMYPRAVAAALKALQLDESSAEAHASIGFIKYNWEWEWDSAERELTRAIQLNPNLESAHRWLSGFLAGIGRDSEALPIAERVRALDPLSVLPRMNLGIIHFLAGRYEKAVAEVQQVLEIDANFARAYAFIAGALTLQERHDEAIAVARRGVEVRNGHSFMLLPLGMALAYAKRTDEARATLDSIKAELPPIYRAMAHTALGEDDDALDALELGYEEHADWMYSVGTQPWFRKYHTHPRFTALLRRLNLSGGRAISDGSEKDHAV